MNLKNIDESQIYSFKKWWRDHKKLYENSGISEETAYTIWTAAVSAYKNAILKHLK